MSLVESEWLDKNLDNVKIIDCSWHMPLTKRNGFEEYKTKHIPNSIFFDLDSNSNKETNLPHMLVDKHEWEKIVSAMGIKNNDEIVIYDNSDVISSCRCWYNFIYFGHDPKLVHILNGGLKKWIKEIRITTSDLPQINTSKYKSLEKKELVKDMKMINQNIIKPGFKVIDARSRERFEGRVAEPRKGLKSGNIEGSKNLPFQNCINLKDNSFKNKEELKRIFNDFMILNTKEKVFSCGSGVTACILGLANSIISGKKPIIYDGSWAEYGLD